MPIHHSDNHSFYVSWSVIKKYQSASDWWMETVKKKNSQLIRLIKTESSHFELHRGVEQWKMLAFTSLWPCLVLYKPLCHLLGYCPKKNYLLYCRTAHAIPLCRYILIGHFVRDTLLVPGWTPFCLQNCLNSSCHKKGALLNWDLVTVEATGGQWTHCHVQETSFRWFELCDTVRYPAESSHQKMGTLWS